MAEYKLLPAFCKPYEDELLSSWLTRMAFDHGLGTKDFCDQIWSRYTNLDIDRLISKENLQALVEQTGCSFEQVRATTLAGCENHIFTSPNDHVMDNWVLANNHQTRTWGPGLLYCPKCLIKKPYFKKQWRLAISFVCTECNCYLNECCPHCGAKSCLMAGQGSVYTAHTNTAYLLTCHSCGNDVTKCIPKPADGRVVAAQKRLYTIAAEGLNEKVVYTESYFRVLHHLAKLLIVVKTQEVRNDPKLMRFVKYLYRVNGFEKLVEIKQTHKLVRKLPLHDRAIVITTACWLLEDWPNRFINKCSDHGITRKMILGGFSNAPFWFWEVVHDQLPNPALRPKDWFEKLEKVVEKRSEYIIKVRPNNTSDYDFDSDEYYYGKPAWYWKGSRQHV